MDPLGISVVRADEKYIYGKYYYYDGPTVYIEITAINCPNSEWRISGRHSLDDYNIYFEGQGLGTFTFDSEDDMSYVLQIQNGGNQWVNTTNMYGGDEENSIINVSFESGGSEGGNSGSDSGGTADGNYYIYIDQGIGTSLTVTRTWSDNGHYVGSGSGIMTNGEQVWYGSDVFVIDVASTDGYSNATWQYQNLRMTSDGRYTMNYPGNIYITSTASSYGSSEVNIPFDEISWTKKNPYPSRTYSQGSYDLSNNTLKGSVATSYQHVVMVKNEQINFSPVNQLSFYYSLSKDVSNYGALIVKVSTSNSDPTDETCYINQQITASASNTEINIDVSSLDSSYYLWIGLVLWGDAGTVSFEVSNLHLTSNTQNDEGSGDSTSVPGKRGVYIGVNNVARKIKDGYIGVDGVARKIKAAYVGVGGVARPCWKFNGKLSYWGKLTAELYPARCDFAITSVGNYALIGGGKESSSWSTGSLLYDVSAISDTLTISRASDGLRESRRKLVATHTDSIAFFAGGSNDPEMIYEDIMSTLVEGFNSSLQRIGATNSLSSKRIGISASHIGSYAMFAGGTNYSGYFNTIDVYNSSLTKESSCYLSSSKSAVASTHTTRHAIFAGGMSSSGRCAMVDAYDVSRTQIKLNNLSSARDGVAAVHVGSYVIFAGGYDGSYRTNTVDVYGAGLSKIVGVASNLSYADHRDVIPATDVQNNYALFDLGDQYIYSEDAEFHVIDVYDSSLTKTVLHDSGILYDADTHVGNYTITTSGGYVNAFTVVPL